MSHAIHCHRCNADTAAESIADLIGGHVNEKGRLCCGRCGGTNTFLATPRRAEAEHSDEIWIKGIVPIDTKTADSSCMPFVFLTAESADGEVTGIAFKYYRNKPSNGGPVKRRRRPRGGPVLAQSQLLSLVGRLSRIGVISSRDWREFVLTADA